MNCPCPHKTAHRTEKIAEREVKSIRRRKGRRREPASSYRCVCGAWHVTGRDR